MQDFRRLQVWQKAHELAVDIFRLSEHFPARGGLALTNQLRRAALSIPSNIAEGAAKPSGAEFHRFLQIAMGSAAETEYQLLLARDTDVLDRARYDDLSSRTVEIRRMLVGLAKRVAPKHPSAQSTLSKPQAPQVVAPAASESLLAGDDLPP